VQIYFDFSGYSDMAIGLGRMFGFRFPENFRWPYVATSVTSFWRRWHISLSTWFRDYLYIPLGGNRAGPARRYGNLVAVFFLCGLWHGASWNFVIWGLWHGSFLVIERAYAQSRSPSRADDQSRNQSRADDQSRNQSPNHPTTRLPDSGVLAWPMWPHVYTLIVVMIGWVFFRADTLPGAIAFLQTMAGWTTAAPTPYTVGWYLTPELWMALAAGALGSAPWVPALAARLEHANTWSVPLLNTAALMALLVLSIMSVAARTYNPFIYFRF